LKINLQLETTEQKKTKNKRNEKPNQNRRARNSGASTGDVVRRANLSLAHHHHPVVYILKEQFGLEREM
jgi:hypothetical protein